MKIVTPRRSSAKSHYVRQDLGGGNYMTACGRQVSGEIRGILRTPSCDSCLAARPIGAKR